MKEIFRIVKDLSFQDMLAMLINIYRVVTQSSS